ncbi:unnamed protein product [Caenorhabditis nigoni]
MSHLLEVPSRTTTSTFLHKNALFYILTDYIHKLNQFDRPKGCLKGQEIKFIQLLIDNSNQNLRMYGSAEELLENINIYARFPGNHTFFLYTEEPFQTRPIIFESLNNEKFIAKSDLFVILQNIPFVLNKEFQHIYLTICIFYLKSRQQEVTKCVEFVKFDEKILKKIEKKVQEMFRNPQCPPAEAQQLLREFRKLNLTGFVKKFETLIPSSIDEAQRGVLQGFLKQYVDILPKEDLAITLGDFYLYSSLLVKSLGTVIDENLEMFSPRRKVSKQPITVRVFEDGDQRFVMESEFKKAIQEEYEKTTPPSIEPTLPLAFVLAKYEQKLANIEFIRYPITRAKHRATPIQGPSGSFYILAIDFFFDSMREMIHGYKAFQKLYSDDVPHFLRDFNGFGERFYSAEHPYFFGDGPLPGYRNVVNMEHILQLPSEDVRNAKKDGFTVENLKNELTHLLLASTFPNIHKYAEAVYSEVDKRKKGSVLRTCDLFDAIEHCQLICILERDHTLKEFVHSQKGCLRVYGWKCKECAAEKSKIQKVEKRSALEKELADLKITHQKIFEEMQQKSLEIHELQNSY